MIRERVHPSRSHARTEPDDVVSEPGAQYNMGKTEKSPVHIPTFLEKNDGDPAIKVCNPMLSPFLFVPMISQCRISTQS